MSVTVPSEPTQPIVDILMQKKDKFLRINTVPSVNSIICQYNALVSYLRHNNFGVEATNLTEYEKFVELFSNFLWAIDAHYDKTSS